MLNLNKWGNGIVSVFTSIILTLVLYFAFLNMGLFPVFAQANAIAEIGDYSFLGEVLALVKSWGGLEGSLKISALITLVISSMKVSYFKKFWTSLKVKLGGQEVSLQVFIVPLLSIVIGLASQGKLSFEAVIAYVVMGGGAVYLHEIIDVIKKLPVISPIAKVIVDVVSFLLGGKKPKA